MAGGGELALPALSITSFLLMAAGPAVFWGASPLPVAGSAELNEAREATS